MTCEADPDARLSTRDVDEVRRALDELHSARSRLQEDLRAGGNPAVLELDVAVLSAVKRLLQELDLDARVRRQVRLLRRRRSTRPAGSPREDRPDAAPEPFSDEETQVLQVRPEGRRRHRR